MPASTGHDWPVPPETPASIPEQPGKAGSFRAGGVHRPRWVWVVLEGFLARTIPWPEQILEVFVGGLTMHNGIILKVL